MYALMVEHFEQYQTVWNGDHGKVYMYQSEIPYDVPNQEVWMSHEGQKNGYASFMWMMLWIRLRHGAWRLPV